MTKLFRLEKQQVLKLKSQAEVPALSSYQQGYQTALRQINLEQRMRTVQPELSQVKNNIAKNVKMLKIRKFNKKNKKVS